MKQFSIRMLGAAAFVMAGLTVGCGGAPEDMMTPEGEAPVEAPAPATQEDTGGEVRAMYFRWQCGANTASLRDAPYGTPFAQINYGEGVDVLGTDGGWWYVRRNATGQVGWTLGTYYCS